MNAICFNRYRPDKRKEKWMKTQTERIDLKDNIGDSKTHPEIPMQEQFIRQVKDSSLPANQVLTRKNDSSQNNDTATRGSTPLFVP
jgi:hypothetical protein